MNNTIDLYNSRVRCAMSDQYVECNNMKVNFQRRLEWILQHMSENRDTISHVEFVRLEREMEELNSKLETLRVAIGVWDHAREICLNIASEMDKE